MGIRSGRGIRGGRVAVVTIRLLDPHRHHPVSPPNFGHSLKGNGSIFNPVHGRQEVFLSTEQRRSAAPTGES